MALADSTDSTRPARIVPAVDRAARLLSFLEEERRPMSISELARRLDASKGSVRDVLETLRSHGLLERDEESKLYRLGPVLVRLGAVTRSRLDVGAAARPLMEALAEECGEVVLLLLRQGERLIIHEKIEPSAARHPIVVSATPGRSIPVLAGACGKVVLAHVDDDERRTFLASLPGFTERSVVDPEHFVEELDAVRAQGYGIDDEEFMDGIRAVAAPVFDEAGLAGVLLVSALAASLESERLSDMGDAVARTGREISAALGAVLVASAAVDGDVSIERDAATT